MNLKHLGSLLVICLLVSSCYFRDCKQLQREDVFGYYISMSDANEDKQYLEVKEDGHYYNRYCHDNKLVEEVNRWEFSSGCSVTFRSVFWLNNFFYINKRLDPNFGFNGRVLSLGEDDLSFRKVFFRPRLECE
jgi:hypothetical protein